VLVVLRDNWRLSLVRHLLPGSLTSTCGCFRRLGVSPGFLVFRLWESWQGCRPALWGRVFPPCGGWLWVWWLTGGGQCLIWRDGSGATSGPRPGVESTTSFRHEATGELLPQGRAFSLWFTGRGCGRLARRSDSGSGLRSSASAPCRRRAGRDSVRCTFFWRTSGCVGWRRTEHDERGVRLRGLCFLGCSEARVRIRKSAGERLRGRG